MKIIDYTKPENEIVFKPTHILNNGEWEETEEAEYWSDGIKSITVLQKNVIAINYLEKDNNDYSIFKVEFGF